jgi:hypothetical protein
LLSRLLWIAALVAIASSASAEERAPSAANRAAAQTLFDEARELTKAGNHTAACPKYAESLKLDPQLGTQLNLAACFEKIGKVASAWIHYHDVETAARRGGDDALTQKRVQVAGEKAAALEPRLSRIAIEVPEDVAALAGLRIERDGVEVGSGQWSSAVPADPGEHVVSAVATGKLRWEKKIEVEEEAATYRVTVGKLDDAPLSSEPGGGRGQRIAGFAVLGVGAAGLVAGAVLGGLALQKNSASKAHCLPEDPNQCRKEGVELRNSAITFGNASTGVLVGGGVTAIVGLVVALTAPRGAPPPPESAWHFDVGPTGATFRARW